MASGVPLYADAVAIILVRHAEAEDRALGTPDPERTLVAAGRRAARATGRALAALKVEPQCVVTSPYPRARETAEIIARGAGRAGGRRLRRCSASRPATSPA